MKRLLLSSCLLAALCGPAIAGPGAHGPGGEHLDAAASAGASGLARLPDGSVKLPKLAQRRLGIRTLLAPQSSAAASLELPARVVADPNASGRLQASHGGRIEAGPRGLPLPGQAVRQGDILAWVRHHPEPYAQAAQQALRAELSAARELAEQRLQRLQSLEGTVPRKDIDAARTEARALAAREQSIAASLVAREPLRSPVSGVVARSELQLGQVVEPSQVLVEIVDPGRLMVEAVTPDAGLAGRIASAQIAGQPALKLELVGAARMLRDGVLPLNFRVRSAVPGQPMQLALGQPLGLVVALKERADGIVLPAEALVRNPANETVVWIKTGAERFMPQPVQARPLDAKTVLVSAGLAPDNRVVVQGAALIAQIR